MDRLTNIQHFLGCYGKCARGWSCTSEHSSSKKPSSSPHPPQWDHRPPIGPTCQCMAPWCRVPGLDVPEPHSSNFPAAGFRASDSAPVVLETQRETQRETLAKRPATWVNRRPTWAKRPATSVSRQATSSHRPTVPARPYYPWQAMENLWERRDQKRGAITAGNLILQKSERRGLPLGVALRW